MNDVVPVVTVGDDLQFAGQLLIGGAPPDCTNWTIAVRVNATDDAGNPVGSDIGGAVCGWLDAASAIAQVLFPRTATADWPVDAIVLLQVALTDNNGKVSTPLSASLRTVARLQ